MSESEREGVCVREGVCLREDGVRRMLTRSGVVGGAGGRGRGAHARERAGAEAARGSGGTLGEEYRSSRGGPGGGAAGVPVSGEFGAASVHARRLYVGQDQDAPAGTKVFSSVSVSFTPLFGELGLFPAAKLTDLYRTPSVSTYEKSANPTEVELETYRGTSLKRKRNLLGPYRSQCLRS